MPLALRNQHPLSLAELALDAVPHPGAGQLPFQARRFLAFTIGAFKGSAIGGEPLLSAYLLIVLPQVDHRIEVRLMTGADHGTPRRTVVVVEVGPHGINREELLLLDHIQHSGATQATITVLMRLDDIDGMLELGGAHSEMQLLPTAFNRGAIQIAQIGRGAFEARFGHAFESFILYGERMTESGYSDGFAHG